MTNVEEELRDSFTRRGTDVPTLLQAPPDLARRVHRRQFRTGAQLGIGLLVISTLGFAGVRMLVDATGTYVPGDEDGRSLTAYASGMRMTYPASWQLMIVQRQRDFSSAAILTNFEVDPDVGDPCADMPPDGVLLIVRPDTTFLGFDPVPWPVDLAMRPAPAQCADDDGGTVAGWSTEVGRTYTAQSFFGKAASDRDRAMLREAFRSLTFQNFEQQAGGPGIVIASGTIDERPWTMTATHGQSPRGPSLSIDTNQEGGGLSGAGFGSLDVRTANDLALSAATMHGNTFLFGGLAPDVARAVVTPDGSDPFDLHLHDLPNVLGSPLRVFVAPLRGAPEGSLQTYDESGQLLANVRWAPGVACWSGHPCPRGSVVGGEIAQGTIAQVDWSLHEGDGELRVTDADGTVLGTVPSEPDPLRVALVKIGAAERTSDLVFGVAPPGTTSVTLFTSGLPSDATTTTLPDGRIVFWAGVTPGTGRGQILAFDSSCTLVGAIDLETGVAPVELAVTNCTT